MIFHDSIHGLNVCNEIRGAATPYSEPVYINNVSPSVAQTVPLSRYRLPASTPATSAIGTCRCSPERISLSVTTPASSSCEPMMTT